MGWCILCQRGWSCTVAGMGGTMAFVAPVSACRPRHSNTWRALPVRLSMGNWRLTWRRGSGRAQRQCHARGGPRPGGRRRTARANGQSGAGRRFVGRTGSRGRGGDLSCEQPSTRRQTSNHATREVLEYGVSCRSGRQVLRPSAVRPLVDASHLVGPSPGTRQ
jgi:hypothetical protein